MSAREDDEPLKAIVLADACGGIASPSSAAGVAASASALPLHGSSLLHWQLHVLCRAGVAEAIVLSSTPVHPALPQFIGAMVVSTLSNASWRSSGDALRDVESRVALRPTHDFVIVQPGALFNLNVGRLVAEHKARVESDRNWLVSLVMRKGAAFSPLSVGVESSTGALCCYADASDVRYVDFDTKAENVGLRCGGIVELLTDVVDVGVDVCSPELLVEFRENFDFDKVRDYIRAKLDGGEAELLGNRMYAHFVDSSASQYATCVDCPAAYFAASADIFDGWMHPILPSSVINAIGASNVVTSGSALFICSGEDDESTLFPDVILDNVVIGNDVSIDAGALIRRSIVGDGVKIGARASVTNSIVCSHSAIDADCSVTSSLLMRNACVAQACVVPADCFIDCCVVIGCPGSSKLLPSSWVEMSKSSNADDLSDDGSGVEVDSSANDIECDESSRLATYVAESVGKDAAGLVVEQSRRNLFQFLSRNPHGCGWPAFMCAVESDSEDELEGSALDCADAVECGSNSSHLSDGNIDEIAAVTARFFQEMSETVERCVEDNIDVDTIALEINSLKLAYERTFTSARTGVVRGLVSTVLRKQCSGSTSGAWRAVSKTFTAWRGLVEKFSSGDSPERRRELVHDMANLLSEDGTMLMFVWRALYDIDVVDGDAILGWVRDARLNAVEGSTNARLLRDSAVFIEWLEESDEEDSVEADS
jgi:translation initiation factor eIF-2B subunit epsilon